MGAYVGAGLGAFVTNAASAAQLAGAAQTYSLNVGVGLLFLKNVILDCNAHMCYFIKREAPPISIRLDDEVRTTLEADAKEHGIGLATYLRNIATDRAKLVRKAKIRDESVQVAKRNRNDPDAREFSDFWDRIANDANATVRRS